jgi:hypothetical protein
MEHAPTPGQESLTSPEPQIRPHLDAGEPLADRRAIAWLQIISAVVTAAFLYVYATALRLEGVQGGSVLLFGFLIWAQLSGGVTRRVSGPGRPAKSRWPLVLATVVLLVVAMGLFGVVVFVDDVPPALRLAPSIVVLAGMGGHGVMRLLRARTVPAPARPAPVSLPGSARVGTVLVGVALAALTLTAGATDSLLGAVLSLVVMAGFIVWLCALASPVGLPVIGACWRWPHWLAFAASAGAMTAVVLAPASFAAGVIVSAIIVLVFVGVSFVPGRPVGR